MSDSFDANASSCALQAGVDTHRTNNTEQLYLFIEGRLFLSSMKIQHRPSHRVIWRPPTASQSWTQLHPVAISYRWRVSCLQTNQVTQAQCELISIKKSLSCNNLPVPSYHATRRNHAAWDTARLPKPRQGKSRGKGQVRTTDLPV
ncbi:hypothetical protein T265_12435, partial [Opisthorchis viverrini]